MPRTERHLPHPALGDPCLGCAARLLSVCGALADDDMPALARLVEPLHLQPRGTVIAEGEPADHLFNVTAGTVKLYKLLPDGRRQITGFLGPGDMLGLAAGTGYAYSAEAVTEAALCRFPRLRLEALLDEQPAMRRRLFAMARDELAAAQEQMLLLGRKTAREKTASFLLGLAERAARRGGPADAVEVAMSRADIADYLGLTTETVSRTLTAMKAAGLIRLLAGGRIVLADRAALAGLAQAG